MIIELEKMYTDTRFAFRISTWLIALGFFTTIFFAPKNLLAEGSVDFIEYPGYRLFYFAERPQQLKVYASAGEFINFGASHVGISSGFINIYRPDGTLHATYNNTGSTAGLGIINNNVEEANGPTGGGSTQGAGYRPGIVEVADGEEGVWTITLGYGFYQNSGFNNLLNNEPWTRDQDQPTNRRVVLSWDITVSQNSAANEGGTMLTGRVFTNEYQSIVSENGNTTSPTFYLLTDEGFQFQIDYQDVDPWGFQIVSNNKGIITGDNTSTYSSFELSEVERSADVGSFDPSKFYLYEPQAKDQNGLINNKVFFNLPDPNLPVSATVTDIVRNDTHITWLLNETPQYNIEIVDVQLTSKDPANNNQGVPAVLDRTNGAVISYNTNLDGSAQLVIDIDNNGIFGDSNDRIVNASATAGLNEILWDGLDKNGLALDQQFNRELSYRLTINAGELHLTLSDIENDLGGVMLTRLNGESPNSEFLYDHSRLGEAVSGGNVLPLPTNEPFTFSNNFGDLKMLDYWTYVSSVSAVSDLILDIVDDIAILAPDTDGDGVRDDSDLDDDNDGILDELEACPVSEGTNCFALNFNLDYDEDFDGIPNYADADDAAFDLGCEDANGDGWCDRLTLELDIDQDGVPNFIDLDADNDGIFDVAETLLPDADNNGFLYEGAILVDDYGRVLLDANATANYISAAADKDNDNVPNYLDRDSDNDGIHDVIESGHEDPEGDGVLSIIGDQDVNTLGMIISIPGQVVSSFPTNKDGDALPDYLDLDADNDGINDVIEGGNIDADNDGRIEGEVNQFGQLTLNNQILSTSFPTDHDGDGIPNYNDLDSDNDGLNDVVEGGNVDLDGNGRAGENIPTVDEDGRVALPGIQTASTSFPLDTDQDGIFDYEDLDSDNDGITDVYEANLSDEDYDGVIGTGDIEVDENGIVLLNGENQNTSNPLDTDNDGTPDFRDLDSDNDTLTDNVECPTGAPCPDINELGGPDYIEFTPVACPIPLVQPTVNHQNSICDSETLNLSVNESNDYETDYPNETITYTWTNGDGVVIATRTDPDFDIVGNDPMLILPLKVKVSVDVDCESEESAPVSPQINPTPDVVASAEFTSICIGGEVQLLVEEVPGATYQWYFNTFPFSTAQNPIIQSLNLSTNFGVVVDLNGCESERSDVFVTAQEPAVIEAISGAGSYCAGEDVTFTAVNNNPDLTGNLDYVFTGPDGLMVDVSVPANGTFEYTVSAVDFVNGGNYSLIVDNGSGCESNIENYNVDILSGPDQPILSSSDESVCPGEDVSLTTQIYTGSNVVYTWILNGQTIGTTASPLYNITNTNASNIGNYAVQVDTGDGCGSSTSTPVAISVVDTSVSPEIENNISGTEACAGQTVNLRVVNPTPETIYTWRNPNGDIIATNVIDVDILNIQMADAGNYVVEANIDGCVTLTDQETIEVSEGLSTPELETTNIEACEGQNVEFTISNFTTTANTNFNWYASDGTLVATTQDPSYTINNVSAGFSGDYYVIVEQGDCISGESLEANLSVSTAPNIDAFAGIDANYCLGESIALDATMPPVGTGIWMSTNGNVVNVNNPNSQVMNLGVGQNMFIWVLNSNGCTDYSRDTVIIDVFDVPNEMASIQNTTSSICETDANSLILDAAPVNEGQGQWNLVNGPGTVSFTNPNSDFTSVNGLTTGTYTFAYTLSTANCGVFSEDEYTITIDEQPLDIAEAGPNQSYCNGAVVSTVANAPSVGSGQWSGNGLVFADANDPNTTVTGLVEGTNILTWSFSNGTCQNYSSDVVSIEISSSPNEQANVVENQINICEGTALGIEAVMPTSSDGNWVQTSGPSATIMTPTQTNSNVNYSATGTYVFAWELSTIDCGTFSTAEVEVVIDALPTELANAGADTQVCGTDINLNAVAPTVGTGFWTSTSGSILDPNNPNATVTGLNNGDHTFTWVLSSGACVNYSSDEVVISTSDSPTEVAEVVNDQINICADNVNGQINLVAIDPMMSTGQWVQMSGPNNIVITDDTESIANVTGLMAGVYQFAWVLSSGNCINYSEDVMVVNVDEIPTNTFADAGNNQTLCGVTSTDLTANTPPVGFGSWSIFNTVGASVSDIMDPNSSVQLVEGENIFVWSFTNGGCVNYHSDTVRIFMTNPDDIAEIITDNLALCESDANSILLEASTVNAASGVWTQTAGPNAVNITNPNDEQINIADLDQGNYSFQWTLSEGDCVDYASDIINISVSELPNEEANVAQDEFVLCDANQITLEASSPSQGIGSWSTNDNATIIAANQSNTGVTGLQPGANTFTWSLSNGNCIDYSQAQVIVFVEDGINAVDDNYTTTFGTTLVDENLVANESLNGNTDWTIELVGNVTEVNLNTDGTFTFIPTDGFSGDYTFEYDICDTSCGTCERALVTINVMNEPVLECDIPNVLTPNNDNKNDALVIDCANQYDNNVIQIFNRWGDKVHEKETYQNDWRGTFKGEDLPAGTYFYVFKKDRNGTDAITGFITIIR